MKLVLILTFAAIVAGSAVTATLSIVDQATARFAAATAAVQQ